MASKNEFGSVSSAVFWKSFRRIGVNSSKFLIEFVCEPIWSWTFFFFFLVFLGLHLQHTEFPRLGVESELSSLPCTTATAMPDPSHFCDLHHSSQHCQVLNPLSKARD